MKPTQMSAEHKQSLEFKLNKMDFAVLLLHVRELNGLTIRELSLRSGIEVYYIQQLENAKENAPSFLTMSRLFSAMDMSIADAYAIMPSKAEF